MNSQRKDSFNPYEDQEDYPTISNPQETRSTPKILSTAVNWIEEWTNQFGEQNVKLCKIMVENDYSLESIKHVLTKVLKVGDSEANKFVKKLGDKVTDPRGQKQKAFVNSNKEVTEYRDLDKLKPMAQEYGLDVKQPLSELILKRLSQSLSLNGKRQKYIASRCSNNGIEERVRRQLQEMAKVVLETLGNNERVALMEQIIKQKSLDPIKKSQDLPPRPINRFVSIIEQSKNFNLYLKYNGRDFDKKSKELCEQLTLAFSEFIQREETRDELIDSILQDYNHFYTSSKRLSDYQKGRIHVQLSKSELFQEFVDIATEPQTLWQGVRADIHKIVAWIKQKMKEEDQLSLIKEVKIKRLLQDTDIVAVLNQLPRFRAQFYNVIMSYPYYKEWLKKNKYCTLKDKIRLQKALKQQMYQLKLDFNIWEPLQRAIFQKNMKLVNQLQLLETKNKVSLIDWIHSNLSKYYEKQFGNQSQETQVRNQLETKFMSLELPNFNTLGDIKHKVEKILSNPSQSTITQDKALGENNKTKILEVLNGSHLFQEYKLNRKIDHTELQRVCSAEFEKTMNKMENRLSYQVMTKLIHDFVLNPVKRTIELQNQLSKVQKEQILAQLSQNKIIEDFKYKNSEIKTIRAKPDLSKKVDEICRNLNIEENQRKTIKDYLFLFVEIFYEGPTPLIPELGDKQAQLIYQQTFSVHEIKQAIEEIQQSQQFLNYKRKFFLIVENEKNQIEDSVKSRFGSILTQHKVPTRTHPEIQNMFTQKYDLSFLQNHKLQIVAKAAKKIQKDMDEFEDYQKLLNIIKFKSVQDKILQSLRFESKVMQLEQDDIFQRFTVEDTENILNSLSKDGISGVNQVRILNENEKEYLRQRIQEIQRQLKEELSGLNEDPLAEQPAASMGQPRKTEQLPTVNLQEIVREFDKLCSTQDSNYLAIKQSKYPKSLELATLLLDNQPFGDFINNLEGLNSTKKRRFTAQLDQSQIKKLADIYSRNKLGVNEGRSPSGKGGKADKESKGNIIQQVDKKLSENEDTVYMNLKMGKYEGKGLELAEDILKSPMPYAKETIQTRGLGTHKTNLCKELNELQLASFAERYQRAA